MTFSESALKIFTDQLSDLMQKKCVFPCVMKSFLCQYIFLFLTRNCDSVPRILNFELWLQVPYKISNTTQSWLLVLESLHSRVR